MCILPGYTQAEMARRMRRMEFERLVVKAVRSLPPEIEDRLDNVAIVIEDWPSEDKIPRGGDDSNGKYGLLGLYEGIPLTDRDGYGMGGTLPDKISIFQRPMEALGLSREETVEEIRKTVLHELGHHMGFSEKDLDRLGYR
jgi:predicted Zn-dependent protease with MMP-like domain